MSQPSTSATGQALSASDASFEEPLATRTDSANASPQNQKYDLDVMNTDDAPSSNSFRRKYYMIALSWLKLIINDPANKEAMVKLNWVNEKLIARNKKDELSENDEKKFIIDVNWFTSTSSLHKSWEEKLQKDSKDKIDARKQLVKIIDNVQKKCRKENYSKNWLSQASIESTSSSSNVASQAVDLQSKLAKSQNQSFFSSSDVTQRDSAKRKSVFFDNIKSEENDQSMKEQIFLRLDESSDQNDDENNDFESSLITRQNFEKGLNDESDELKEWSNKRNVKIIRYESRNALVYMWRSDTIDESEKRSEQNISKLRRSEDKLRNSYKYKSKNLMSIQDVCWRWNIDEYFDEEDSFRVDLIDLANIIKSTRFKNTLVKVVWDDDVKTWETRTAVRRLWSKDSKVVDKQIYNNACFCIDRYLQVVERKRSALSRSPTLSFDRRQQNSKSRKSVSAPSKTRSQTKAKLSRGAQKKVLLIESSDQENAKMSKQKYLTMTKEALSKNLTSQDFANLAKGYDLYVRQSQKDESQEDESQKDEFDSEEY